jgi:hypothetical protein
MFFFLNHVKLYVIKGSIPNDIFTFNKTNMPSFEIKIY